MSIQAEPSLPACGAAAPGGAARAGEPRAAYGAGGRRAAAEPSLRRSRPTRRGEARAWFAYAMALLAVALSRRPTYHD